MRVQMGGDAARIAASGAVTPVDEQSTCYLVANFGVGAASASWLVEVLPSGQTGRIVLETFAPSADVAKRLEACFLRTRYAAFDGDQPRLVRVPLVMGMTEGARLRRRGQ